MVYASAMDDILGKLSRETTPTVQDRLLVCEKLPQLEAKNPTTNPAYSPYLDGEWELIYSGGVSPGPVPFPTRELSLLMYAGGFTPGMFLMSVANKVPGGALRLTNPKITIESQMSSATAKVTASAFGSEYELSLKTTLEAESALRLRETYTEAIVAGRQVALPDMLKWERLLFVTYLDARLMVVRDETGAPDILLRTSPNTQPPIGSTAPSSNVSSREVEVEDDDDNFVQVQGSIKTTEYDA